MLAGGAGRSGAEWSLFWPGIGMAPDSWAALILPLDRPAVGSGLAGVAGASTLAAAGTDGSAGLPGVDPVPTPMGVACGGVGSGGALPQALSADVMTAPRPAKADRERQSVGRFDRVRIGLLSAGQ